MKILVFEYIVGGGFAGQALPPSLAAEGGMMLQALLDDLKSLPHLTILLPLDRRYQGLALPSNAEVVPITDDDNVIRRLPELIARCDAIWPIAPESGGVLADIAESIRAQGKISLLSSPEAVRLCGDKHATYLALSNHGIPAVETRRLTSQDGPGFSRSVIKPFDGVGCIGSVIVDQPQAVSKLYKKLEHPELYVIQPYCEGRAISLSCLFGNGKAWLICCNEQRTAIVGDRFVLMGCVVNIENPSREGYQGMVEQIAQVLPGLWGYVGIDIIETPDKGPLVLEINPRLTTSYVGIRGATGVNIAEQVLRLLQSEPDTRQSQRCTINITIE